MSASCRLPETNAHNLCPFEDLATNVKQGKERHIDILERRIRRHQRSECAMAGDGLLLTCHNEIRSI
jgi:hypothetical protein